MQISRAQVSYTQPPENLGGKSEFNSFLMREMNYPKNALAKKIEGTVTIEFTVDTKGLVTDCKIISKVEPSLDAEAMRLFNLLCWKPAIKDFIAVEYTHKVDINFKVKTYEKYQKKREYLSPPEVFTNSDTSLVIYSKVITQPKFNKNDLSFEKYILLNLIYPQEAYQQNLSGEVIVKFVVECNGQPSNIEVIVPLNHGFNAEAARLIAESSWIPAQVDEKYVRSTLQKSITFKFKEGE